MPAARQHLCAVQRHTHARADLEAFDRAQQERVAVHLANLFGACDERRQNQRRAMQRPKRMEIVELETLNEGAVEQRRGRARSRTAPADDRLVSSAFEARDGFDRQRRPRQFCADQRATDAIEQQIFRAFAHDVRHIVQRQLREPVAQHAGDAIWIAGGTAGARHQSLTFPVCQTHGRFTRSASCHALISSAHLSVRPISSRPSSKASR